MTLTTAKWTIDPYQRTIEAGILNDRKIEIVYSSGGPRKLLKYQALGVPEVWFWEDGSLRFYHLRSNGYEEVVRSELSGWETLDVELLKRCILMGETDTKSGFATPVMRLKKTSPSSESFQKVI